MLLGWIKERKNNNTMQQKDYNDRLQMFKVVMTSDPIYKPGFMNYRLPDNIGYIIGIMGTDPECHVFFNNIS